MPTLDPAQLAAEYTEGKTLRQIGEQYYMSHTTVAAWLKKQGVPRRRIWGRYRNCPVCARPFRDRQDRVHCSNSCRRAAQKG